MSPAEIPIVIYSTLLRLGKGILAFGESHVERSGDAHLSKLTIFLGTTEAYFVK